ncbi:hypothetical protein NDU88_003924 [Pleurodeles waltl]|uniref:Uncharacterized protein n=1 Tax=Pleurodeles waltl TaxID=8319 RepID=A0AAV7UDX0_PLEWA|nr:hypothetical protein NDU88_003924 [Pleurodeles waltl]
MPRRPRKHDVRGLLLVRSAMFRADRPARSPLAPCGIILTQVVTERRLLRARASARVWMLPAAVRTFPRSRNGRRLVHRCPISGSEESHAALLGTSEKRRCPGGLDILGREPIHPSCATGKPWCLGFGEGGAVCDLAEQ